MLELDNVSSYYGESIILKNMSMKIEAGKVVCLLGRNGVGKTTFLKSIMGLVKTPGGSIKLEGEEIIKMPTYNRAIKGIGYVPQGRDIFPQLSVYENLLLGLERNRGRGTIDDSVYELFPVVKTMLGRKGGDLSGGQQQQLAIARALVSGPKLLLLDEPTEGIQPSIIQDIARVIRHLKEQRNMTMVIVEQYLEFVMEVADYFYLIDKGRIIMEGSTADTDPDAIQEKMAI
ncbi:high-affinity branched-chain amino acid transport ATP-binding protein LivF [Ruminiclostridium hungatei]|uniref:High-affinity branched-chain amino acid transport ATP-binding protein LivF n=1 Tax=Ruminiclostridium hungatei TaxID=48256 RepID=A0A1V4SG85_RUMHU|nr:urea ABC transporter ATP-binding subunit UrtE [Ruminiclostridium hungatei]OPX42743.1 high-affinity branched-chain amino acid transport ATP-binding protein LivF [Ruminiclostridium hungatei]